MNTELLACLKRLPEAGTPIDRQIDGIRSLLERAEHLEATAQQLRGQAAQMQAKLLARAKQLWTADELATAGVTAAEGRVHP